MSVYRVFVSSTTVGLQAERDSVRHVLERMRGAEFAGMEIFGSREDSPLDGSLREVDDSHLYIGIIGGRYGSGITHAEYERARERGIHCLLYIQRDEAVSVRDDDRVAADRRAEWIARLTDERNGHLVTWFARPGELGTSVAADVHNWLYRRLVEDARRDAVSGSIAELRALIQRVRNRDKLRAKLIEAGVAMGDDLLDSLLALFPASARQLLDGIHELPTDYGARIENFLSEYLGSAGAPVPFGGRGHWLAELDAWLAGDRDHPCVLVAGEAGRGKSAALVHWSRRWIDAGGVHMVFVPVSIRFRTNLASVFFPVLAARLARVHGDEIATDLNLPVEAWRGMVADFLRRPPKDGRTIVIVIDGLDEAADWEAGPDLLPRRPPDGVRIVVSARLTATAPDADAWLDQLGWSRHLARAVALEPLTRNGVREVVVSMGFPLNELGTKVDVIHELHRLSAGDPLMVRLYVDELWARGQEAVRLVPEDLAAIRPGLAGYFDRWWREQKALWGQAAPLKERGVRAVLNLLAVALGPLSREDILGLAPPDAELDTWTLDDALQPLRRFVIEEPAGLVFSHPRFAQYLMGELTSKERTELDEQFVSWSAAVRRQLEEGSRSPVDTPRYLIQFSGAHLERLGSGADELCALLTPEWRQAWESADGGLAGFASDVERAVRAARLEKRTDLGMFCFLLKASIRSISHRLPGTLVQRLLEESVWRPRQASAYARTMAVVPERVEALTVASRFVDADERASLLEEARSVAAELQGRDRVRACLALLRAGDPPRDLIDALRRAYYDDLWLAAARELVETDRIEDAAALCLIESITVSGAFSRWLASSGQFKALHILLNRRSTVALDPETEWQLLLLGDEHVVSWTDLPHERIRAVQADLDAGRPVHLSSLDVRWLFGLFECWEFSGVLTAFACRLVPFMSGAMRQIITRMFYERRHARRAVLLKPDDERERMIREWIASERGNELRTLIEETVPLLRGDLLEEAVAALADRSSLKVEDCRALIGQLVANDARAVRRAVTKLEEGDRKLMFLCAAAEADREGRPELVRRIHALLTRSTPTEIVERYLDMVAPYLDGTVLRGIIGAMSRLSDDVDVEMARFLVDPQRFAEPPRLLPSDLMLLVACLPPENLVRVVEWMIESPAFQAPAVLDLIIRTRLPSEAEAALMEKLWTRVRTSLPAVIDSIPWMQDPPTRAWCEDIPGSVQSVLVPDYSVPRGTRHIAVVLIQPVLPPIEVVLKRPYTPLGIDPDTTRGPFRHLQHLFNADDVSATLERNPTEHAILALGHRADRVDINGILSAVIEDGSPERLCALLPFLDGRQRELAVEELLSSERLPESAEVLTLVLLGIWIEATVAQLTAIQTALIAALTPSEVLRIARALRNRPELATLIAAIHRQAPLPPPVLRQVLDIVLDPNRPVTRREALQDIGVAASMIRRGNEDTAGVLSTIQKVVAVFP